jgi:hypothetical protein
LHIFADGLEISLVAVHVAFPETIPNARHHSHGVSGSDFRLMTSTSSKRDRGPASGGAGPVADRAGKPSRDRRDVRWRYTNAISGASFQASPAPALGGERKTTVSSIPTHPWRSIWSIGSAPTHIPRIIKGTGIS